jgi:hypothetical protein
MTQLVANFEYGPNIAAGTAAQSKSFAYDESQYVYSQSIVTGLLGPTMGTAFLPAANSGVVLVPCYTNKQLRSITASQVGTGTGLDNIRVLLLSPFAQAFGTATGVSQLNTAVAVGTFYGSSTQMGTYINVVTINTVMSFGTGNQGAGIAGGTYTSNGGTAAFTSQTVQFSNGTFAVVVANPQGTNTQNGYVFPVGPQGGLSCNPGDVIAIIKSATDTQNAYLIELEFTYTPGAYVTR